MEYKKIEKYFDKFVRIRGLSEDSLFFKGIFILTKRYYILDKAPLDAKVLSKLQLSGIELDEERVWCIKFGYSDLDCKWSPPLYLKISDIRSICVLQPYEILEFRLLYNNFVE